MFTDRPDLQCQSIVSISPSSSGGSSPSAAGSSFPEMNNELGVTFKSRRRDFFQSRSSWIGVTFGWEVLNCSGISIDSTSPVPIPFEIDDTIFFWVGFLLLSTAKMYFLSGLLSEIFFTIPARSLTWIVGKKFEPSPTYGSLSGSCNQAFLKCELKMASPFPYRIPAEMT